MHHSWFKTVFPIAALFSFRMFGLFMLIPVFTLYANQLTDSTPTLIGIALGAYGLSQGLLQIPMGLLSDKIGRKPVLTAGLILFALGSLAGALTHSINGMIVARIIQGMGAIGSVLIALLADLTPDDQRTKSMAVIGMSIGLSFGLAMIVSPAISTYYGLKGIFLLSTLLAFLGLILLHAVIPTPLQERGPVNKEPTVTLIHRIIANSALMRLNAGIFFQHLILTSTFYTLPLTLESEISKGHLDKTWHFYLPLMIASFLCMIPFIMLSEKKHLTQKIMRGAVGCVFISEVLLSFTHQHWLTLCGVLFIYFVAFNILEAMLPSSISKQAPKSHKGTAMGVYSTCQFLGIFAGGLAAGILYTWGGGQLIFIFNAVISMMWFLMTNKPNRL